MADQTYDLSLQQYGGIYLDIDVLVLESFANHNLLNNDLVLAMEAKPTRLIDGRGSDDEMAPKGLCNAIIMAKRDSVFLKRWYETYEHKFDDHEWSEHSIVSVWPRSASLDYPLTGEWFVETSLETGSIIPHDPDGTLRSCILLANMDE